MTEKVPYQVTGRAGDIEFRKYPPLVFARTGSRDDKYGFNILFSYISGKNEGKKKISMTSPVFSDKESMSFLIPQGMKECEIPAPSDGRVRLVKYSEMDVAVIRFRGYATDDNVKSACMQLKEKLEKAGIETHGDFFLMRYNPPWIPGFMRRNEAGIVIKRHA